MTNKNKILLSTLILGQLPTLFFGMTYRLNLSLFVERSTRVDFFAMYYVNAISFLILAYCIHFNKGIDKKISKLIFIITILDFLHLILVANQGFGMSKVGIAMAFVVYEYRHEILNTAKRTYYEMLSDLRELKSSFYILKTKIIKFIKQYYLKIKTPIKRWLT